MKAVRLEQVLARELDAEELGRVIDGRVLVQELRTPGEGTAFAKGQVLTAADAPALAALDWTEIHLLELEEGEVHEKEAGPRLAGAVAGEGVRVGDFAGGHWPLEATRRGVLTVNAEALVSINVHQELSVYTAFDGRVTDEGDTVARAKVIPFAVAESVLAEVEAAVESAPPVSVRPFTTTTVGAVVQESLGESAVARFRESLGEKVAWFGSTLAEPAFVAPEVEAIARAITDQIQEGAGLLVVAGTKAMDPLDPAFGALERVGARMERHGVPAHPGSLFWIAELDGTPILGMPSCGLFSRATVFDLVLPRVLAGLPVGSDALAAFGHGGLLTSEMAWRFPRYRRGGQRGELE